VNPPSDESSSPADDLPTEALAELAAELFRAYDTEEAEGAISDCSEATE
jgi:hypothetical protein